MNEATLTTTPDGDTEVIGTGAPAGPEDGVPAADVAAMAPEKEIPGPNPFEVRGYEVAKLQLNEWVQVSHYRPTQAGLIQAVKDARWLADSHPRSGYAVRVLVSAPLPMPQAPEEPLRLEADEPSAESGGGLAGVLPDREPESTHPSTESGE